MSKTRRRKKPSAIEPSDFPKGKRTDLTVALFEDALGFPIEVPFIVVRGATKGPVLGVTAAVHGDELNGIRIIHELMRKIDPKQLAGTLICAPVVAIPAYRAGQRRFPDGTDLNHSFPGKRNGRSAEQFAWAFTRTFLPACDYLVDIHTASEGRINSFYVRADLENPKVREMALLMDPDIALHVRGGDGTLRAAARRKGTLAITVEAGNPRTFQRSMTRDGVQGILNIMRWAEMLDGEPELENEPVICRSSQWIYTTSGGILYQTYGLRDRLEKKQLIAETRDPFGEMHEQYFAPNDGIVIGMAQNPVAVTGTRFCHLGVVGEPGGAEPTDTSDESELTEASEAADDAGGKR